MIFLVRTILFWLMLSNCKSRIYLYQTADGFDLEFYDCLIIDNMPWCRRPYESIDLHRDDDHVSCNRNAGKLYRFEDLRSNGINVSRILHEWKSGIERAELYSRYLREPSSLNDGFLCQCINESIFGKNCEYRLPHESTTVSETWSWHIHMRTIHSTEDSIYGDILCYETLSCNSGLLCLDWREICDGVQNCMNADDEQNCDLLEMNICGKDEYRCMNGMCIPEQFFLDGEFDCLDASDEIPFKSKAHCSRELTNSDCDDHLCPPHHWSCGDGQCIHDRFLIRRTPSKDVCINFRDRYYMCETHPSTDLWTLPNGRCYDRIKSLPTGILNVTEALTCEFLLRCSLSGASHIDCLCSNVSMCIAKLNETCSMSLIPYPDRPLIRPFLRFFYDRSYELGNKSPSMVHIDGNVQCQGSLIYFNQTIPLRHNFTTRYIIQTLCINYTVKNITRCSNTNQSTSICKESNPCLSITRLNDGFNNCIDGKDESQRNKMEVAWSCAHVHRHRLRCSIEEPTCLNVMAFDRLGQICKNISDQLLKLKNWEVNQMKCNEKEKDDCRHLRQLIEQSWIDINSSALVNQQRIPFRFYCDTFADLKAAEDENIEQCRKWWQCDRNQISCGTKQCLPDRYWANDLEWDCADGSDMHTLFSIHMNSVKDQAKETEFYINRTYFLPQTCHSASFFACFAAHIAHQPIICLNQSQLGDGKIDCAGAIDEQNTMPHCSQQSMLGPAYHCLSTNTCIPFVYHCQEDNRCPNRTDDERWCLQKEKRTDCSDQDDFKCFDGECVWGSRCGASSECRLGEDEYMCDFPYIRTKQITIFRKTKRIERESATKVFQLPRFPRDAKITIANKIINQTTLPTSMDSHVPSRSLERTVAFRCNRGIGLWSANYSTIFCLCPPHYYGEKCEYYADRLIVLLQLDLSESIYSTRKDPTILLKFLVSLLFHNQTLSRQEFEVRPAFEITISKKRTIYFPYSHIAISRAQRRQRFYNRTDLLDSQPYSIRIEGYETKTLQVPSLVAIWQYSVNFDYLPVYRFARVLRWHRSFSVRNPCLSSSCHSNEECQRLMNNPTQYLCICKANFTGRDCQQIDDSCVTGYCAPGSLCRTDPTTSNRRNSLPYCICSSNQSGQRCEFQHETCSSLTCFNGGSCFSNAQSNEVLCWCHNEYYGHRCELRKASIRLIVDENASYDGIVLQFFDYHPKNLDLILIQQRVYSSLPPLIEYYREKETIPSIVLSKLYSSYKDDQPQLYLLSLYDDVSSIDGKSEISEKTRCIKVESIPPIQYHQICRNLTSLLCFHDDIYLCICVDDHTRVECFLYDHQLDQCDHCLIEGRCLRGDYTESNDFLCLCPPCHSGEQCQFSSKSFTFTLDQLLYTDLVSENKQRTTISLLLFFSILNFVIAIPNNIFSFVTFRRKPCRRNGIGYYLLVMSIINQIHLGLFLGRLIHIIRNIATTNSATIVDEIFCKLLNYLLLSSSRLVFWLSSLVAIERLYTTLIIHGRWLKQPHIARRLIIFVFIAVLSTSIYELLFYKSLFIASSSHRWICMFDFPKQNESFWMIYHLLISTFHSLLPFTINLCATIVISIVVVKKRMNTHRTKRTIRFILGILRENKELVIGPGFTLIPQMFSLPLVIFSFSLDCQNIENSWLRYLLIASYWISLTPKLISFFLYISPSSFYLSEWHKTRMAQMMKRLWFRRSSTRQMTFTVLSVSRSMNKIKS